MSLTHRITAGTIWAPGALADVDARFRPILTWVLPVIYSANLLMFGVYGVFQGGSRLMQQYLPWPGPTLLSVIIGLSGFLAFWGLSRRNFVLERVGAILLVTATITYLGILVIALISTSAGTPLATIVVMTVFVAVMAWRVFDLSAEIGKRRRPNTTV